MNAIEFKQMIGRYQLSRPDSKMFAVVVMMIGFFVIVATLGYFSWQRQLSIANAAANELSRVIESDLHHNESFSDAVSMLYMRLKRTTPHHIDMHQEFDHKYGIYGVNLHSGHPSTVLQGTLQSDEPLTQNSLLLSESIDMAADIESKQSRYSKMERRYFLAHDSQFIYITHKMPLDKFIFKPGSNRGYGVFTTPQSSVWLNQKLHGKSTLRATEVSHVYIDSISGAPVITVQHAVLDQDDNDNVLGWLCFDYQQSELQGIVESLGLGANGRKGFLNIFLFDKQTNTEFRIVGESGDGKETQASINDRYDVIVTINPLRYYMTQSGRTDLLVLLLAALCFLAIYLIYDSTVRAHRNRSQRDLLTGLYNRNWMQKVEALKASADMTVVMIDCNNFKIINDTYGHGTGDRALKHIGQSILGRINTDTDFAVRMGGDEFFILFKGSCESQAHACMRRIEHDISLFSTETSLSISYGVCPIARGMTLSDALAKADSMMYHAKKSARKDGV